MRNDCTSPEHIVSQLQQPSRPGHLTRAPVSAMIQQHPRSESYRGPDLGGQACSADMTRRMAWTIASECCSYQPTFCSAPDPVQGPGRYHGMTSTVVRPSCTIALCNRLIQTPQINSAFLSLSFRDVLDMCLCSTTSKVKPPGLTVKSPICTQYRELASFPSRPRQSLP